MPSTDVTPLFRAIAKMKAVKLTQEDLPRISERKARHSAEFSLHSRGLAELAADLAALVNVILTQRADYLAFNAPTPRMRDSQRDRFDSDSEKALRQMQSLLEATNKDIDSMTSKGEGRDQERRHLQSVVMAIQRKAREVAQIVAQMRALRLRHDARRRSLLRLSSLVQFAKESGSELPSNASGGLSPVQSFASYLMMNANVTDGNLRHRKPENPRKLSLGDEGLVGNEEENSRRSDVEKKKESGEYTEKAKGKSYEEMGRKEEEEEESTECLPANAQMVAENERVYEKLASIHKELDTIEEHVAEIHRLQETFAEKLLGQERDIDILHDEAIHTTENLREGNAWIREAITNSASRRVVVLFCIVVLTFVILFVDWYNP